CQQYLTSPLTF
nr:immunoglobulin light chain junction region [Macaca mulatta]